MFKRLLLALSCAAVALPAGASATPAPSALQTAVFRVQIRGTQTTRWTKTTVTTEPGCDSTVDDAGNEQLQFATPKPETADVFALRYQPVDISSQSDLDGRFLTKAVITRHSTENITLQPSCGTGVAPAPLTKPDCGTKTVTPYQLDLVIPPRAKTWVGLSVAQDPADPFTTCMAGGTPFPHLLYEDTYRKPILVQIPKNLLFDPHVPVIFRRAGGDFVSTLGGATIKTKLRWQITMVRTRGTISLLKGLWP